MLYTIRIILGLRWTLNSIYIMVDETEIEDSIKKQESRKNLEQSWFWFSSVQCSKPSNIQSGTYSVGMEKIIELGP